MIPGRHDATTANWPQRPLHRSLLKQSCRYGDRLVSRSPNPYACRYAEGVTVLGTDGRNVQDLCQHVLVRDKADETSLKQISELNALSSTLKWAHICPTGPDSVPTMPHAERDPMVIQEKYHPQVYFAGNCNKFATSKVGATRLVCVPRFSDEGQAVLVKLPSLDVELVKFEE